MLCELYSDCNMSVLQTASFVACYLYVTEGFKGNHNLPVCCFLSGMPCTDLLFMCVCSVIMLIAFKC